jgi:hypothetical protein
MLVMVYNGTVEMAETSGGGLGSDGKGQAVVTVWSAPVKAYIRMNRDNELGWSDGIAFRKASYEVLIKPPKSPSGGTSFNAGRVRLAKEGRFLGEYSVMNHDVLQAVGMVKIIV